MSETEEIVKEEGLVLFEKKALEKVNPLRERLNVLREEHKELPDLSTTAGEKKAREQIKAFRDLKGDVEEERKDVKAVINRLAKAVDDSYNAVWDDAEKEQKDRDEKLKTFIAEKKRLEKEKEDAEENLRLVRVEELHKLGATYQEKYYILGDAKIEYDLIKKASDDLWQNQILSLFTAAHATIEAERQAEEQSRREAQEEQERKEKELKDKELQLQQREAEQLQERFEIRMDRLRAIGLEGQPTVNVKEISNDDFRAYYDKVAEEIAAAKQAEADRKEKERIAEEDRLNAEAKKKLGGERFSQLKSVSFANENVGYNGTVALSYNELVNWSDDDFIKFKDLHNARVVNDEAEAERVRLEELEKQRKAAEKAAIGLSRFNTLKSLGVDMFDTPGNLEDTEEAAWEAMLQSAKVAFQKKQHDEWLAEEQRKKDEADLLEKERQADMSDGEKWREWKGKLAKFASDIPEFKTKRYGKMKAIALEKFSEIQLLKAEKISSN